MPKTVGYNIRQKTGGDRDKDKNKEKWSHISNSKGNNK